MAYNQPGVRVNQQVLADTVTTASSELSTCIIGPLYQTFDKELVTLDTYNSLLSTAQVFTWPNKPTGSVVDLNGIRGGLIDSQRKLLASYTPYVYLIDKVTSAETVLADSDISAIDQDGFSVTRPAGTERATITTSIVSLNNENLLYAPAGGFTSVQISDVFEDTGSQFSVDSFTTTELRVKEASGDFEGPESLATDVTTVLGGEADQIDGVASATPGRTTLTIAGVSDFAAVNIGDVAITGKGIAGLTTLAGTVEGDVDPGTLTGLTLSGNIDFTGYNIKVVNSTLGETYFVKVVSFDASGASGTHTITVDNNVGDAAGQTISATVYLSQLGYVESKSVDNSSIEVVTPLVVSEADTFVEFVTPANTIDFYPQFDVKVDYRVLRRDLANNPLSATQASQLPELIGSGYSVDYRDGLGYAVAVCLNAQPLQTAVYFIPVDLYPDDVSPSGLLADQDESAGYSEALEAAETIDVYQVLTLSQSSAVQSALSSHVASQSTSTENNFRRGFTIYDVPLGDVNSVVGEISPGRTPDGLAPTGLEGNKSIKDPNVNFLTGANVVAGNKVVVTFPAEYAGEYTVDGSSTDTELVLTGDDWTLTKEFSDLFSVASYTVTTGGGLHTISSAGPPAVPPFTHVEPGDYVELTVSGTVYRMKVISVSANFQQAVLEDEVAGDLTFAAAAATGISVIRSYGYTATAPYVSYYIRPNSKSQQVSAAIAAKGVNDRRMTAMINQSPTVNIGAVPTVLDPTLTMVAVAAQRSGSAPQQDVTNLLIGGGIDSVKYGFGHFTKSQLNLLAENGYTLVAQSSRDGLPFIRDMLTSKTGGGLVESEEVVTSNADAQSKILRSTFTASPGQRLNYISYRLLGARTAQIDAILKSWIDPAGDAPPRLIDYVIVGVTINPNNKRQIDIEYTGTMPLAEKEIEFTINLTV